MSIYINEPPSPSPSYHDMREEIRRRLEDASVSTDAEVMECIEAAVLERVKLLAWSASEKKRLIEKLYYSFRGLDVLEPLLKDDSISEIMVNSCDEIFIEKNGIVVPAAEAFESREKLEHIIQTIVGKVNRVVNESSPIVDARLEDGSRVNVVMPPIALKGPTLTIRKFPEKPLTMNELIARGTITPEAAELLQSLVRCKYNIFIGGGTGSGKTTFLNVLSAYIPSDERVITIEDSAELQIKTIPNLVRLETRNANSEGKGEITIRELIRSSLRMRPNRIIVGEVRGPEAFDMLQAMNTGHDGSLSTGHANSVRDMLSRLETMVLGAAALPIEVIRKQIVSAVDMMVHLTRWPDHSRRVAEIVELAGLRDGEFELNPLFVLERSCSERSGAYVLVPTGNKLVRNSKLGLSGGEVVAGL